MTCNTELVVDAGGCVRCIYDETLNLLEIGKWPITRASPIEPDAYGHWWADMVPSGEPVLGPFTCRTEALSAAGEWLSSRRSTTLDRSPKDRTTVGTALLSDRSSGSLDTEELWVCTGYPVAPFTLSEPFDTADFVEPETTDLPPTAS